MHSCLRLLRTLSKARRLSALHTGALDFFPEGYVLPQDHDSFQWQAKARHVYMYTHILDLCWVKKGNPESCVFVFGKNKYTYVVTLYRAPYSLSGVSGTQIDRPS